MTYTPPSFIAVVLVLLSVVGIITVAYCVDFLKPPGRRARVDHHKPPPSPLKGIAHAARAATQPPRHTAESRP